MEKEELGWVEIVGVITVFEGVIEGWLSVVLVGESKGAEKEEEEVGGVKLRLGDCVDGVPEGVIIDIEIDSDELDGGMTTIMGDDEVLVALDGTDKLDDGVMTTTGGDGVVLVVFDAVKELEDSVIMTTGGREVVVPELDIGVTGSDELVDGVTTNGGGDVLGVIELELVDGVITTTGGEDVVEMTELEEFVDTVTTRIGGDDVVLLDTDEDEFVELEIVGVTEEELEVLVGGGIELELFVTIVTPQPGTEAYVVKQSIFDTGIPAVSNSTILSGEKPPNFAIAAPI